MEQQNSHVKSSRVNGYARVDARLKSLENWAQDMDNKMANVEKRLTNIENIGETVDDILHSVNKVSRYVKIAAPSIVSAAIAAGVVNGKLGAFLHALFP